MPGTRYDKDEAVCIRAVDYSETSQIVTFFTRGTGKISAIAKGSKRPKSKFDGPIEILSAGQIVFTHNRDVKLATLTEFQQHSGFVHSADNLFAMNCCLFAIELLNSLTDEYDPHPQLFDNFLQFLKNARKTSDERLTTICLLILFQLSLLKEVGLMPILDYCANCKTRYSAVLRTPYGGRLTAEQRATSDEFYFSSSANGLVCRDCEACFPDRIRLTKPVANCLGNLKLVAESNEKTLEKIEKVLVYHFTELLGKQPRMAKHILNWSIVTGKW